MFNSSRRHTVVVLQVSDLFLLTVQQDETDYVSISSLKKTNPLRFHHSGRKENKIYQKFILVTPLHTVYNHTVPSV